MAKCSNCKGNNAQKAEMIAKAGTSSTKGIGMTAGGFAAGFTQSKTTLAKQAYDLSFIANDRTLLSDCSNP